MIILLAASYEGSIIEFRGDLIAHFVSSGHQVIITAPDISDKTRNNIRKLRATPISLPLSRTGLLPIADYQYFRSLKKLIKETNANLLLTYTIKPNIYGGIAAGLAGIKSYSMVTGLGYAFTDNGSFKQKILKRLIGSLYRISTKSNTRVIFQNADDRSDFIDSKCLTDTSKTALINGSGVNLNKYQETPLPDKPVFLLVARLLVNKGVREYFKAAMRVRKSVPESRFLLVGFLDQGPDSIPESELKLWCDNGIEYLGHLADIRPSMKESSVYVLPSYREGTPRSVLEAMAMGRPIITTDAPGCRETVVDGENGYLVPVKSYEILAEKMILLAEDDNLRKKMGRQSRIIASKKFDSIEVAKSIAGILNL